MASAALIYRDKGYYPDGGIVEMTIWRLPSANPERPHGLKYSLFYGRDGERIVGYDNERGKGDHRHIEGREVRYSFSTIEQMTADFIADVRRARGES
jgi:Family of unknown function (DUF6516)